MDISTEDCGWAIVALEHYLDELARRLEVMKVAGASTESTVEMMIRVNKTLYNLTRI